MSKGIVLLLIFLYLISLMTGGFVLFFGNIAETMAKYPLIIVILLMFSLFLLVLTALAIIYDCSVTVLIALLFVIIAIMPFMNDYLKVYSGKAIKEHISYLSTPLPVKMTRIIPLETAGAYAESLLQIPTHFINFNTSYLYYANDTVIFCMIVEPEGFWNSLRWNAKGIILVNGSNYPPKVTFIDQNLYWSFNRKRFKLLYFDSLKRQLKIRALPYRPLFENAIEVCIDRHVYILVPIIRWERGLSYSYPVLHSYAVIDEDGEIELVKPNRLSENRVTHFVFYVYKAPIVPEIVARQWVELLRWSVGYLNVILYHKTFVIRDIGLNAQPYLVYDDNGHLYWLFVVEPSGKSYAVKYIIYVDAESIEPRILLYEPTEQWIGASKLFSYIQKAHPTYDWDKFRLAEPIPIIVNDTLYWKITIITSDARGVVSIDLVNAKTGVVYSLPVTKTLSKNMFNTFVNTLSVETTKEHKEKPSLDRIQSLKQRIKELIDILQELLEELEEMEKELKNKS